MANHDNIEEQREDLLKRWAETEAEKNRLNRLQTIAALGLGMFDPIGISQVAFPKTRAFERENPIATMAGRTIGGAILGAASLPKTISTAVSTGAKKAIPLITTEASKIPFASLFAKPIEKITSTVVPPIASAVIRPATGAAVSGAFEFKTAKGKTKEQKAQKISTAAITLRAAIQQKAKQQLEALGEPYQTDQLEFLTNSMLNEGLEKLKNRPDAYKKAKEALGL